MSLMRTTVGDVVFRTLDSLGVDTLFGIPGTQTIPLYEALRRSSMRTVLTTSETAAAFAANGYYRSSRRPAAISTIPGPGFTLALTGLAEARHDSVALIYLLVNPVWDNSFHFRHQELDIQTIAGPIVKSIVRLTEASEAATQTARAYRESVSGEPGPVILLIDQPLIDQSSSDKYSRQKKNETVAEVAGLKNLCARLENSGKPLFIIGQGSAQSAIEITKLIDITKGAAICTTSGRGTIADSHPRCISGDLGMIDAGVINSVISQADLVIALGCKFSHNGSAGFGLSFEQDKLVHVDTSEEILDANYRASVRVHADVKFVVGELLSEIVKFSQADRGWNPDELRELKQQLRNNSRRSLPDQASLRSGANFRWSEFFSMLNDKCKNSILVTDSGLHQMIARAYMTVDSPGGSIIPSNFQSMGFGLPAAIGAAIASPRRELVLLVGDGGLMMSSSELGTAVREGLSITVLLLNDGNLGFIRKQQIDQFSRHHSVELSHTDFAKLTEAHGGSHYRPAGELKEILTECCAKSKVKVIEIFLEPGNLSGLDAAKGRLKAVLKRLIDPELIRKLK